jgi:monoamine oxidase
VDKRDRWLQRIGRRDFLEGVLLTAVGLKAGSLIGCSPAAGQPPRAVLPVASGTPAASSSSSSVVSSAPPPSKVHGSGEFHEVCHAAAFPVAEGKLEPESYDVVVLGAGPSGLAAAWALQKAGVAKFLVIDKEEKVGGQARLTLLAGKKAAVGAAYSLPPWNDLLTDFYKALKVVDDKTGKPFDTALAPEPANRVWMNGKWFDDAWGDGMKALPLPAQPLAGLIALRKELAAYAEYKTQDKLTAFDAPVDAGSKDKAIRGLDAVTFAAWVRSKKWSDEASAFFDPYCRSALGLRAEEVSAFAAINFLQSEFSPVMTQPGGNAYLAERLGELIGLDKFRLKRTVVRVEEKKDGVYVTTVDGAGQDPRTIKAKRVVSALPQYISGRVLIDQPARAVSAMSFKYAPYLVVNLALSDLDKGYGYDNWLNRAADAPDADRLVTDFIVADAQSRKGSGGPGVITAYCPVLQPYTRKQVRDEPFDVWAKRVVAGLSVAIPDIEKRVEAIEIFRWGHALALATPGHVFSKERDECKKPLGAIHFAHTDLDGTPAIEGAIAHGVRAAHEAAKALGKKV